MNKQKGFTLLETVVALAIAVIVIGFFLAALIPAGLRITESKQVEEARLLAGALEAELKTPRQTFDEDADLDGDSIITSFEKTFDWVSGVAKEEESTYPSGDGLIIAFKYRADAHAIPTDIIDGVYPAYIVPDDEEGDSFLSVNGSDSQPMTIKTRIGKIDDILDSAISPSPLDAVEGTIYAISLTQIIPNLDPDQAVDQVLDTSAVVGELKILLAEDPADPPTIEPVIYNEFSEAIISLQADFYTLDSNAPGYLRSLQAGEQELSARPVYSTKFGVLR